MSLFGNPQTQQPAGGSLFGNTNNNQNKPSLFGASTSNNNQPQQSTSLFGAQPQQQQQQQQQQNNAPSLFGGGAAPSTSLFGQSQSQPQQNNQQQQGGGLFGGGLGQNTAQNTNQFGASLLNTSTSQQQPQNLQQSRLGQSLANSLQPRERDIMSQFGILFQKWNPQYKDCIMQTYFYNNVPAGTAPFWGPGPEDDEQKWEEALAKKPTGDSVPVLVKGFEQLGHRLQLQVQAIRQLQMRLHEMNNSLEAMMQTHELKLSVRAAEAKRKHIGLSQKCLNLAIKVQVARSRGFVLDGVEEDLKKRLAVLEKGVFDPGFAGREEEIWARMVALRERTRWLSEESEKVGRQVASGEMGSVGEEVLKKTKKILGDYDAQISHLRKELEQVSQEYTEWEAASKPSRAS